jgi:hypothetical protein
MVGFHSLVLLSLLLAALPGRAETAIESSVETRFQLDLQIPDAISSRFLPRNWLMNVATSGNAKDCNVRMIFVDRLTVNGPDGKPAARPSQRYVYLEIPATTDKGEQVRVVIGGITADAADAPGPFGNFLPAESHEMTRNITDKDGKVEESQTWSFRSGGGESVEMHVTFERGVSQRNPVADTKFISAKDPSIVLISRQEQVLDVVRNASTNPPDRVKEFSLKVGGGTWDKIFNGSQRMLSWDNVVWISRTVLKP